MISNDDPRTNAVILSSLSLLSREEYLEKVRGAAKKSRNPYLSVMWTEGGAQPALEQATGLTFGYPALVAVSVEKKVTQTVWFFSAVSLDVTLFW